MLGKLSFVINLSKLIGGFFSTSPTSGWSHTTDYLYSNLRRVIGSRRDRY
jgi:hypothetical protein